MPPILKNRLAFTGLSIGVPASLPHLLNIIGLGNVTPKLVLGDKGGAGFTITADDVNVTVTRGVTAPDNIIVYVEYWHTYEDAQPVGASSIATSAWPVVVVGGGGGGGTGSGNFAIEAGTQSVDAGTVIFADSNGLSFAMSGSSQITASMDALRSVVAGGGTVTGPGVTFSNSNGVSFGISGAGVITASVAAAGGVAISADGSSVSAGTVVFSNSNGVSFGMSGSTMTASVAAAGGLSPIAMATNGVAPTMMDTIPVASADPSHWTVQRLAFDAPISATAMQMIAAFEVTDMSKTIAAGLYSVSGQTMGLLSSASSNVGFAAITGPHPVQLPLTWDITQGDYALVVGMEGPGVSTIAVAGAAFFVGADPFGASTLPYIATGIQSLGLAASLVASQLTQQGATVGGGSMFLPHVRFLA